MTFTGKLPLFSGFINLASVIYAFLITKLKTLVWGKMSPGIPTGMLDVIFARTTEGHPGSNACNSAMERDVAEATSMKQEARPLKGGSMSQALHLRIRQ